VFERFDEQARQVLVLGQDEARALKHNYLGVEHFMLGLLRQEKGLAAEALASFEITVEELRAAVARIVGQGDVAPVGQIPFTPRAKKVIQLALNEAFTMGQNYLGAEHLLLGVARESEGVAARILSDFDIKPRSIAREVLIRLSGRVDETRLKSYPEAFSGDVIVERETSVLRLGPDSHEFTAVGKRRAAAWNRLLGWLLFGIALATGVIVGWLIWG
jgi:ATP-dependent Clp protease ATP-binding subunit ClpC